MNSLVQAAIQRARDSIAQRNKPATFGHEVVAEHDRLRAQKLKANELVLNKEQQLAVDMALRGDSFCVTGSAGVGKTTVTEHMIYALMQSNKIPMLEQDTKCLTKNTPGAVLIAYTRRAVRNIAKRMPEDFKSHCMTFHALVEYAPENVETILPDGTVGTSKPFLPQRRQGNKLPVNLTKIFIDEASMFSVDFFNILWNALPDPKSVQFIFIGDINQLPPIYGDGILGLQINRLPVVELTQVYRQALESPIIKYALAIKDNQLPSEFNVVTKIFTEESAAGKVTFRPWTRKVNMEEGMSQVHKLLTDWVNTNFLDFNNDVILCPWGKKFGTIEMNKSIGTALARKRGSEVYEVIAGFNKHYYSVGDKILINKLDAEVIEINRNPAFLGRPPQPHSLTMDYWGWGGSGTTVDTEDDIDKLLESLSEVTDRVAQASHILRYRYIDSGLESSCNSASEFNSMELAYALSVHKSQGSEWQRVFVICHDVHSKMMLRELTYTAFTRASKELYVIMPPTMLKQAATRAKIKGTTLEEKKKWFAQRLKEKGLLTDEEDN